MFWVSLIRTWCCWGELPNWDHLRREEVLFPSDEVWIPDPDGLPGENQKTIGPCQTSILCGGCRLFIGKLSTFPFFFPESSVLGHRLWGRVQTPFPSPSMARPWRPRPGDGSGLWLDAAAVSMARQKFWNQQLLDRLIYTHIYIDCLVMSCCIYTNIHICNNI